MEIGIDKMSFFVPESFVSMVDLAHARHVDPDKYTLGLGQLEMAVAPVTQDVVTLAANAAKSFLTDTDKAAIDMVLFATETGIDCSKAAAVYVHQLLGLPERARAVELKQACYGGTTALQFAKGHIALHPNKKVLVLAADIAKYGLATPGEATQGAGAVAMLVSAHPRIAVIEDEAAYLTRDIMDFWRPMYADYAFADGKFSTEQYLAFLKHVWHDYQQQTGTRLSDLAHVCFHMPFSKLAAKGLKQLFAQENVAEQTEQRMLAYYEAARYYNQRVGNIYTGSLYLSLLSLLERADVPAGSRIGLFSYGSGAVAEWFTVRLQPHYQEHLLRETHERLLNARQQIDVATYEQLYERSLIKDGTTRTFERHYDHAPVYLSGIDAHRRVYRHDQV